MSKVIRIHEKNNKIFSYNGQSTVLVCATEHYGAVMNRPFDYHAYLADCYEKKQNYTRLFLLFRELQTHNNPISTCKPQTPDYISPYKRTGPGLSFDGLPKYDLDQWNDEFFNRLHEFIRLAQEYDVIVEIVLFSNSYNQDLYRLLPICSENNINGIEEINFNEVMSMHASKLFACQKKYVEKIVAELNSYPNIIYEICNEPVCFNPAVVTEQEINAWQDEIIKLIRYSEKDMLIKHLIAGEECWSFHTGGDLAVHSDHSFRNMDIDIVNIHPLESIHFCGRVYNLGSFMSKQLALKEFMDFCMDTKDQRKVMNIDEDNTASEFLDYDGWTIHRKRAWTAVMCGSHYDYIDFSILNPCPTGTAMSQKHIRTWFKYLQDFISQIDLPGCIPCGDCVTAAPPNTICSSLCNHDSEYNIYIADTRELADASYGKPISGKIEVCLEDEDYTVFAYSPEHGQFSVGVNVRGGKNTMILLPKFLHDIVIRIVKTRGETL